VPVDLATGRALYIVIVTYCCLFSEYAGSYKWKQFDSCHSYSSNKLLASSFAVDDNNVLQPARLCWTATELVDIMSTMAVIISPNYTLSLIPLHYSIRHDWSRLAPSEIFARCKVICALSLHEMNIVRPARSYLFILEYKIFYVYVTR